MPRIVPENAILIPEQAKCVFQGAIFDVYQWPQELFDGTSATFELLRRPDTVIFLAVKDDKIIFITEQQPARPSYTRLPGGRVDPGEDWDTAVRRECSEEIGMQFANWKLIDVRQPVAKIEWFVATYIAWDCTDEHAPHVDPGEKIALLPKTFTEAKALAGAEHDPLNDYTRALFAQAQSMEDLIALPTFKGRML